MNFELVCTGVWSFNYGEYRITVKNNGTFGLHTSSALKDAPEAIKFREFDTWLDSRNYCVGHSVLGTKFS